MSTPYEPIERRVPKWLTARPIMESLVPDRLRFMADIDNYRVGIDWRWAQSIVNFAPPEDQDTMADLMNAMMLEVGSHIPMAEFDRFLQLKIDNRLLADMDGELDRIDREAASYGYPTLRELVRHHLGLEHCFLVTPQALLPLG
jgi:hypothetical protein